MMSHSVTFVCTHIHHAKVVAAVSSGHCADAADYGSSFKVLRKASDFARHSSNSGCVRIR